VVVDAADRSFFMAVYMAAKRLGVNAQTPGVAPLASWISAWRMSQLAQFPPPSHGTRGCFTPQSCRADRSPSRQLWANSRLMQRSK
jgi:hypothetical protein